MRKINDWEKKVVKTASIRIPPFSFSITPELEFLSKECGINDSDDLNSFLIENSQLSEKEFKNKIKNVILEISKIVNKHFSKVYRKHRAEKIMKLHSKKEIKERMFNYVKNKEYNN